MVDDEERAVDCLLGRFLAADDHAQEKPVLRHSRRQEHLPLVLGRKSAQYDEQRPLDFIWDHLSIVYGVKLYEIDVFISKKPLSHELRSE